jgi:hypothetical protein
MIDGREHARLIVVSKGYSIMTCRGASASASSTQNVTSDEPSKQLARINDGLMSNGSNSNRLNLMFANQIQTTPSATMMESLFRSCRQTRLPWRSTAVVSSVSGLHFLPWNRSKPCKYRSATAVKMPTTSPSLPSTPVRPTKESSTVKSFATPSRKREYQPAMDDFSLLLQHQDFPTLVSLAAHLKQARKNHHVSSIPDSPSQPRHGGKALQADEVLQAVEALQKRLLSEKSQVISRGNYPLTDMLMDDILQTLRREICATESMSMTKTSPHVSTPSSPMTSTRDSVHFGSTQPAHQPHASSPASIKSVSPMSIKSTASNAATSTPPAIATKYTKQQTDILMTWMIQNVHQPFPSTVDIAKLMEQTGLSQSQVINWTTNVRKRNRKATCEHGKKPHHFLDFLFLKQHKMNQDAAGGSSGQSQATVSTPKRDMGLASAIKDSGQRSSMPWAVSSTPTTSSQYSSTCWTPRSCPPKPAQSSSRIKFATLPYQESAYQGPMEHDVWEPLQDITMDDENKELLSDFADFWLKDEQPIAGSVSSYHPPNSMPSAPSPMPASIVSSQTKATPMSLSPTRSTMPHQQQQQQQQPQQFILPSVTNDSHDYECCYWPYPHPPHPPQHQHYPPRPAYSPPPTTRPMSLDPSHHPYGFVQDDHHADSQEDIYSWASDLGLTMESI